MMHTINWHVLAWIHFCWKIYPIFDTRRNVISKFFQYVVNQFCTMSFLYIYILANQHTIFFFGIHIKIYIWRCSHLYNLKYISICVWAALPYKTHARCCKGFARSSRVSYVDKNKAPSYHHNISCCHMILMKK